jgi:preprotein translocase subunit SecY
MKRSAWRYLWTSVDIRKKLLITLALLILYRLAANIPVPINRAVISGIFQQQGPASSLLGVLTFFQVVHYQISPSWRWASILILQPKLSSNFSSRSFLHSSGE